MQIIDEAWAKRLIQPRQVKSHKGTYGRVLLIGGTSPYGGAIIMAALACVNSGAGLVTVATDVDNICAIHVQLPEAMAFDMRDEQLLLEQILKADVIEVGSGLNPNDQGLAVLKLLFQTVQAHQTLVIDGSAITLLAQHGLDLPACSLIFTPHQMEWQRLSGLAVGEQTPIRSQMATNRLPLGSLVVVKGYQTQLYQSQGQPASRILIGGPYQATGGMGDTLAGMIAGFVAQFAPVYEATAVAVFLHSYIAEELSRSHYVVKPTQISQQISKFMKEFEA